MLMFARHNNNRGVNDMDEMICVCDMCAYMSILSPALYLGGFEGRSHAMPTESREEGTQAEAITKNIYK